MSYINRNRARQTGTNRTTQAEISNLLRLSFPGRVTRQSAGVAAGIPYWGTGPNRNRSGTEG
jgi:hypothetical protein